jgi:hypothetical protein
VESVRHSAKIASSLGENPQRLPAVASEPLENNYVKRIGQESLFVPIRTAVMLYRKKDDEIIDNVFLVVEES